MRWVAWWRPPCLLRAVVVNLKGESSAVRGVLWRARGPWLVLVDAAVLQPGHEPVPVDGEVILHRNAVLFMQVMP